MGDKGYFSKRILYINSSWCWLSISGDKESLFSSCDNGVTFTKGNLCFAFRQIRGGQRTLPASVDSQLPSAENNPYDEDIFWGWPVWSSLAPLTERIKIEKEVDGIGGQY